MATVDRSNSSFWRARFTGPDGKRITRSLKTHNYKEALKLATDLELAAKRGRAGSLTTNRGRAVLNEILEAAGQTPLDTVSTRAFCAQWMLDKAKNAAGTRKRYQHVMDDFVDSLGAVADRPLASVHASHMETYRNKLTKAGLSPRSLRLNFKIIAGIFTKGVRQGIIAVNPCGAVEVDDAVGQSREPFSEDEVQALLRVATEDWKTAIFLGAFTGMRLGDAVNLRWDSVDLAGGRITYTPQKTLRKRVTLEVPTHPRLLAHLESIAGDIGGPICRTLAGKGTGGKTGLSRQFIAIMEAAGINRGATKADNTQSRAVSAKSFHSLRHYFNTELLRAGVDEKTRMDLSGHTTTAISRKYAHTDDATRRAAIEKL